MDSINHTIAVMRAAHIILSIMRAAITTSSRDHESCNKAEMEQIYIIIWLSPLLLFVLYIIIWLSPLLLFVHSLSPPKPAGLDPPNFRRRTLYYMRKSLGIFIFDFWRKKIGNWRKKFG
jgi:hypothetical protein